MNLNEIKGVGPKVIEKLNKLNIQTKKELISFYPFRYEVIKRSDKSEFIDQNKVIIDGILENNAISFRIKKNLDKMTFSLNIGFKLIKVVIFNRGFLRTNLKAGTKIYIIGKYDLKNNTIIANDIFFGHLSDKAVIEPIYHTVKGITSKNINLLINNAFKNYTMVDYIPDYLSNKYNFLTKKLSINEIHNPSNDGTLKKAILRTKYEELFKFLFKITLLKNEHEIEKSLKRNIDRKKIDDFIKTLPFTLTDDQIKSVDEICADLVSNKRMNRLLQGDVGSGKTIVSIISMYINFLSGYQSALMAPTEILAIQHFNNTKKLLEPFGLRIGLLTGKLKSKDRKELLKKIYNNEIDIIIGTHALISEDVIYPSLGLVITDEQHRFGVNQRGILRNKGIKPDILYMSATPIPRTYALTIYGDMDISSIKTMPIGRKKINTLIKSENEIKDVLSLILNELKLNHQIYVVAPLIEESESSNMNNIDDLKNKFLKAFGKNYCVEAIHGKMKNEEKEEIMNKFKENKINILISTTVIEVGIDVKNATTMVIFDAYKFGLSTLHQLRGRVGRSDLDSYCVLISNTERERLNILQSTQDGFLISEEDFKLRGSGDIFGIKQSGDMVFDLADIRKDYKILLQAKKDSYDLFNLDIYKDVKSEYLKLLGDTNYLN